MFFAAKGRRTVQESFLSAAGPMSGLYRPVTWLLPTSAASLQAEGGPAKVTAIGHIPCFGQLGALDISLSSGVTILTRFTSLR